LKSEEIIVIDKTFVNKVVGDMYKTVMFVDFENLQRINESLLTANTKLVVLCGINQDKMVFDFAKEQFSKPCTMEFIKPNVQGNNALDFCVVFYAGLNYDRYKNAHIVIYSKDKKDYDPLIKHLQSIGVNIERREYEEPKVEKKQTKTSSLQKIDIDKVYNDAIKHFEVKQTKARPRKIETLKTYLQKTVFNKKHPVEIIEQVVRMMLTKKVIEETNTNGTIKFNLKNRQ